MIKDREGKKKENNAIAIDSKGSPAPGIMPGPVGVHDEPTAMTAPRGERRPRDPVRDPATRDPVSNEPTDLEVE